MDSAKLWLNVFTDMVEGRPGPFSLELTDNSAALRADVPIEDGAKPKPELIVALLRSGVPLTPELRNAIADFLDANASTAFCYKSFGRRKRGQHPNWSTWHMEAALFVEEQFTTRGAFEAAVELAMAKFDLHRSQVTDAWKKLKKVREIEHNNNS